MLACTCALFVAGIAVGRVGDAVGAAFGDEEFERIAASLELALLDELGDDLGAVGGVAEDVAHHEHQERADPALLRDRKDVPARALVHQAVGQHDDFPRLFVDRARQQ